MSVVEKIPSIEVPEVVAPRSSKAPSWRKARAKAGMPASRQPLLVYVVLVALLLACLLNFRFLGRNLSGWAWMAGLLAAGAVLLLRGCLISFPVWLWAPWAALVFVYSFIGGYEHAYQSAAQILCPLVVGTAASCARPGKAELERFLKLMRIAGALFVGLLVCVRLPMLFLGILPGVTGLAAESIAALVFQSYFLCSFILLRNWRDLVLYLLAAAVPVVAVTRGPIAGGFALLALTLAPMSFSRRALWIGLAILAGLAVFQTERVQQKMFWSGHGTLRDLRLDNPDLQTSGRNTMADALWQVIPNKPWFGHGGNATAWVLSSNGIELEQVHNDWLRILCNYGYVGVALHAFSILAQVAHGWFLTKRVRSPHARVLAFAAISAFVPYAVVMFADNLLIYAQFFGNLQFLLLGLAYGASAAEQTPRAGETGPDNTGGDTTPRRTIRRRFSLRRFDDQKQPEGHTH